MLGPLQPIAAVKAQAARTREGRLKKKGWRACMDGEVFLRGGCLLR
ncbi:MAG: hypothetical protein QM586_18135 [Xenophilus sp.]